MSLVDAITVTLLSGVWLRWASLLLLGLIDARRISAPLPHALTLPSISVLIPAYNEEKVIEQVLKSVLQSDLQCDEILVLSDGSTDQTIAIAAAVAEKNSHVRVIDITPNGGKARALNLGLKEAIGEIIITVDADTRLDPTAIDRLARTLVHRKAAAVASNIKVGNRLHPLAAWQSLEYIGALNLDRRGQRAIGLITTVPGAAAAWRASSLRAVGGFSSDTLAEDTDLTLSLLRAGLTVEFQPSAIAWTEAPSTLSGLIKQRNRWLYGNLQCAWKHRDAFLKPVSSGIKWIALPNLWFAHLGLQLIALWTALTLPSSEIVPMLGALALGFLVLDALTLISAWTLDRERWRDLLWLPLQRTLYPPLLWWVFVQVMLRLLLRTPVAWNKLDRRGLP